MFNGSSELTRVCGGYIELVHRTDISGGHHGWTKVGEPMVPKFDAKAKMPHSLPTSGCIPAVVKPGIWHVKSVYQRVQFDDGTHAHKTGIYPTWRLAMDRRYTIFGELRGAIHRMSLWYRVIHTFKTEPKNWATLMNSGLILKEHTADVSHEPCFFLTTMFRWMGFNANLHCVCHFPTIQNIFSTKLLESETIKHQKSTGSWSMKFNEIQWNEGINNKHVNLTWTHVKQNILTSPEWRIWWAKIAWKCARFLLEKPSQDTCRERVLYF